MKKVELNTIDKLAELLGYKTKTFAFLYYKQRFNNSYHTFTIPKKSGGERIINAPNNALKKLQRRLVNRFFLSDDIIKDNPVSHGYTIGKSIFTNAEKHIKKAYVLNVDIQNYFEQFHFGRIRGFLMKDSRYNLNYEMATIISNICCYNSTLPQGAPTSPVISNIITEILDKRILKICFKYKLNYSRYVDDLTFSTNEKMFILHYESFLEELLLEIEGFGMSINPNKIRMQYNTSKQDVTGITVNKKINTSKIFYKETRAMAHSLYSNGYFLINDCFGTLDQLEGRFSFINHVQKIEEGSNREYITQPTNRATFNQYSGKKLEYQKFYFYNNIFNTPRPVIITEGKTDILYLKAAILSLHEEFPDLVSINGNENIEFKVKFFERSDKSQDLLGVSLDGADTLKNLFYFFNSSKQSFKMSEYFKKISGKNAANPIILIYDNERHVKGKSYPLRQLESEIGTRNTELNNNNYVKIYDNLYGVKVPKQSDNDENFEIEDLFKADALGITLDGKTFSKLAKYDTNKFFGKNIFSKYIYKNYKQIDFTNFKEILSLINSIINEYASDKKIDD